MDSSLPALVSALIPTPLGEMLALASRQGLCLLEFNDDQRYHELAIAQTRRARGSGISDIHHYDDPSQHPLLKQTVQQIEEYFLGQRRKFSLPLDMVGTPFQQQVWRALLEIPYGQTWSYAQEASFIGRPTAVRAVANANGQNKISIVIPCHRVIGSNGTLTGYGGGLERKRALLDLENSENL